jgi:predicted GNAT family acetyltransferase
MARATDSATVERVSSTLRRPALRVEVLHDRDRDELIELVDADPVVNVVVSARLRTLATIEPRRFGGTLLGVRDRDGRLTGAAFCGGNLLPIGGGPDEWQLLAETIGRESRSCTSMVGRAAAVAAMWDVLAAVWDPPRAVREQQPLLTTDRPSAAAPHDRRVRPVRTDELEVYLPAAAAMFSEELGISPYRTTSAVDYRRRTAGLIKERRAFGIIADGAGKREVLFKADLGAISAHTCQVQGVWVRPDLRGRGLGTSALAVVLQHALTLAPTVSLYVNDFNVAARRMYDRLGLEQAAVLSTVLF